MSLLRMKEKLQHESVYTYCQTARCIQTVSKVTQNNFPSRDLQSQQLRYFGTQVEGALRATASLGSNWCFIRYNTLLLFYSNIPVP